MREQIWATLNDLKFKGYCLSLVVDKFQRWDRGINSFLAIASSGSIAAWAIWNKYPLVWGTIIAVSQVLTAIKPFFPFFKYVKELNAKCFRVEQLNIEFEHLWYKIQNQKITSEKSEELYFEYKKTIADILSFGDDTVFNVSKIIESKANEKMKRYLKNHYQIEININQ